MVSDHIKSASANSAWDGIAREPLGQHGLQGVLRTDAYGSDNVCARPQTRALY